MKPLRLALYTPETAKVNEELKNSLSLAILSLGEPWMFVDSSSYYGLLCIFIQSEGDLNALHSVEKRCPLDRLIVIHSIEITSQAKWQLALKPQQQPELLDLINLLSHIQTYLYPELSSKTETFNLNQYFTGILNSALSDSVARLCSIPDYPTVYLLPKEDIVYVENNINQLIPLAISQQDEVTVEKMTDKELLEKVDYVRFSSRLGDYAALTSENTLKDNMPQYLKLSFQEAIWFSTLFVGRGRLLSEAPIQSPLPAFKIPDFVQEKHKNLIVKIERFKKHSLESLLAKEKAEYHYEIINLYNACLNFVTTTSQNTSLNNLSSQSYCFSDLQQNFQNLTSPLTEKAVIVIAGENAEEKNAMLKSFNKVAESNPNYDEQQSGIVLSTDVSLLYYEIAEYAKFDFTAEMICENAWGLIILINNTEKEPFMILDSYLKLCQSYFHKNVKVVIGINDYDKQSSPSLEDYQNYLKSEQKEYPVVSIKHENDSDSIALLIALLQQNDELSK